MGVIESLGGFAVVLIFSIKFFVSGIERRMLESELIEKFYQVDKSYYEGDYKAEDLRADPLPVMPLDNDFNTSKQALKNRKKAVQPFTTSQEAAHKRLKIKWQEGNNYNQRVSKMVESSKNQKLEDEDVQTIQEIVLNRINFKPKC